MIVSISQSEATRQFVREQEIETNKGLFTPPHREEKLLVSDMQRSKRPWRTKIIVPA